MLANGQHHLPRPGPLNLGNDIQALRLGQIPHLHRLLLPRLLLLLAPGPLLGPPAARHARHVLRAAVGHRLRRGGGHTGGGRQRGAGHARHGRHVEGRGAHLAAELPSRGADHREQGVGGGGNPERSPHVDAVRYSVRSGSGGASEEQCEEESEGAGFQWYSGRRYSGGVYWEGDGQDAG